MKKTSGRGDSPAVFGILTSRYMFLLEKKSGIYIINHTEEKPL